MSNTTNQNLPTARPSGQTETKSLLTCPGAHALPYQKIGDFTRLPEFSCSLKTIFVKKIDSNSQSKMKMSCQTWNGFSMKLKQFNFLDGDRFILKSTNPPPKILRGARPGRGRWEPVGNQRRTIRRHYVELRLDGIDVFIVKSGWVDDRISL